MAGPGALRHFRPNRRSIALVWICIVLFSALFAPLLANSYPIAAKIDGRWSSPLLTHLTPSDVVLVVTGVVGLLLLCAAPWMSFRMRLLTWVGALLLCMPLTLLLVHPPGKDDYGEYRELQAQGRLQRVIRTPLPYSPSDYLHDEFDLAHPHPRRPSPQHPFGTTGSGSDILSRMIHASRLAMSIGFISTGIALVVGTIIGGLMGYFARWVDLIGMRLVEIFSAIPSIYLLLACVAFLKPLVRNETGLLYLFMVIIGLTSWVSYARFARAEFLKLRQQDFVHAAVAAGLPIRSVLFKHILPNAVTPLLVTASFGVAGAILAESSISFLGLGMRDDPSWGQLLSQAVTAAGFRWWLAVFPGLAIFLTLFAYNLIGEAMRNALDPKLSLKREE